MTAQTPEDKKNIILDACADYKKTFAKAGIRATFDSRDNYTPGWKFNHWEMKVYNSLFYKMLNPLDEVHLVFFQKKSYTPCWGYPFFESSTPLDIPLSL